MNHELLPPGRRTSPPHAHSHEEEFVFVLAGRPDVWVDGYLYRLTPGDAVAFPAETGVAHTFINNTQEDVRLLVVGETSQPEDQGFYPLNSELRANCQRWWKDAPPRPLGPHDGHPDLPS